jgi:hypothetical protein
VFPEPGKEKRAVLGPSGSVKAKDLQGPLICGSPSAPAFQPGSNVTGQRLSVDFDILLDSATVSDFPFVAEEPPEIDAPGWSTCAAFGFRTEPFSYG